jgi:hypothetical protein
MIRKTGSPVFLRDKREAFCAQTMLKNMKIERDGDSRKAIPVRPEPGAPPRCVSRKHR